VLTRAIHDNAPKTSLNTQDPPRLTDALFTTHAMRAVLSDRSRVQRMLDFEAALARAEAAVGVIPASAAPVIAAQCKAELYDIAALALATADAGNPAIPLVKALTSLVVGQDPEAARYVHWGATSQDAMDTGLVLQLREALGLVATDLARLSAALAALAGAHTRTLLAGRTWLQQATPVTLGLKAGILSAVERHRARIADLLPRMAVLQFGGPRVRWPRLARRGLWSRRRWRGTSASSCPTCRGTRIATASPKSRRRWASSSARSGKPRVMCPC
jgi:3-carboxy-cis,cis-muconate cycloisomerase